MRQLIFSRYGMFALLAILGTLMVSVVLAEPGYTCDEGTPSGSSGAQCMSCPKCEEIRCCATSGGCEGQTNLNCPPGTPYGLPQQGVSYEAGCGACVNMPDSECDGGQCSGSYVTCRFAPVNYVWCCWGYRPYDMQFGFVGGGC